MVTRGWVAGERPTFHRRIVSTERPFRKAVLGRRTTLARVTFEGEHGFPARPARFTRLPSLYNLHRAVISVCYSPWERSRYCLDFRGNSPRSCNSFPSSWNAIIYRECSLRAPFEPGCSIETCTTRIRKFIENFPSRSFHS